MKIITRQNFIKTICLSFLIFFGQSILAQDQVQSFKEYNSVDTWLKDLKSSDKETRYVAALGLNSLGKDKNSEFKKLLVALKSPDPFVRQYSAIALGNLQFNPSQSIKALIALFNDSIPKVRLSACWSTMTFGSNAIPELIKAASNSKGVRTLECFDFFDDGYTVTNKNLYAILALRNMADTNVILQIVKNKKIPFVVKNAILEPYRFTYQKSYDTITGAEIFENKLSFIRDIEENESNDTFQRPEKNQNYIENWDSAMVIKYVNNLISDLIDNDTLAFKNELSWIGDLDKEQKITILFNIISIHEWLYPQYKYVFDLLNWQKTSIYSPFYYIALYNAGNLAADRLPELIEELNQNKKRVNSLHKSYYFRPRDEHDKIFLYRVIGKILSNSNSKVKLHFTIYDIEEGACFGRDGNLPNTCKRTIYV